MNYTVNLGCWGSIFAVPTEVVDKHLKIAGSAQLKVLLYILRHSADGFSDSSVSKALGMDVFDVKDCIEFWSSFGVISVTNGVIEPAPRSESKPAAAHPPESAPVFRADNDSENTETYEYPSEELDVSLEQTHTAQGFSAQVFSNERSHDRSSEAPNSEQSLISAQDKPVVPEQERTLPTAAARPLRPDPIYVAKRVSEDKEIEALFNEAQFIFGRPISPNENSGMIMLHDNEGLPCEVILMLITYGKENNMGMRKIESMGAEWAREGILTVQSADEKIRRLEESKEAYHRIQRLFGLEFRKPSKAEEENYTRWITEWKFSDEMLKEAYDTCVNAKGKYITNYVNRILNNWYNAGIRTVEQAHENKKRWSSGGSGDKKSGGSDNSSFDVDDLSGFGILSE